MGACEGSKKDIEDYKISFKCYYDIQDYKETQIINDRIRYNNKDFINKEIKSKIKILNNGKKEKLIFKKRFNNIGINTIDFIIEEQLTNLKFLFFNCTSLKKIEFLSFDTSQVIDMNSMFSLCIELEDLDLSSFNTSNLEIMRAMFFGCNKLKEIKGLNNFNTSKVNIMLLLFSGCKNLECLDLSNFDISNVENIGGMFNECHKLKEIKGLNNFNTSKVIIMDYLFNECYQLEYLDLSNFNTSCVINMEAMFKNCYKLKEIKGLNNFKTFQVNNMKNMFSGCKNLDYISLSNNKIIIDDNKLNSKLNHIEQKPYTNKNIIAIIFYIPNKNINFPIACCPFDVFTDVEQKLYDEFPELKNQKIYFIANGNVVDGSATLEKNKIKNGTTILLNYLD